MATVLFSNDAKAEEIARRKLIPKRTAFKIVRRMWEHRVREHRRQLLWHRIALLVMTAFAVIGWLV